MSLIEFEPDRTVHPVDIIEHIAAINDWNFERQDTDEISISVRGSWSDYHVSFNWMQDLESLHIASAFDLKVPEARRPEVKHLVAMVNEPALDRPFRHLESRGGHPLPQLAPADRRRRRDAAAMRGSPPLGDRNLRPLLSGVPIRGVGGKSAAEALESVLFETVGEA